METRVRKIAVVGAESTGKTELCMALASFYKTIWVPEFAREYFNHSSIYNYTQTDLEKIADEQVEAERNLFTNANGILFCDTAISTLKIWSDLEFGDCPQSILNKLKQNKYDFYLLTNNEVDWEKDEQRLNKFSRDCIFEMNEKEIKDLGAPYGIVSGLGEQRIKNAMRLMEQNLNFSFGH